MFLKLVLAVALTALAVATTATVVSAAPADVRCVQQSLLDAGFDPNGIDGKIGRGTRAAAAAYIEANPKIGLPELSLASAQFWCGAMRGFTPDIEKYLAKCSETFGVDLRPYLVKAHPFVGVYAGEWFQKGQEQIPGTGQEHALFVLKTTEAYAIGYFDGAGPGTKDDTCTRADLSFTDKGVGILNFPDVALRVVYTFDASSESFGGDYTSNAADAAGSFEKIPAEVLEAGID